jgi:hypothetical protein
MLTTDVNFIENLMKTFLNFSETEKSKFLQKMSTRNFTFDFFNIYSFFRMNGISKQTRPAYIGIDYLQLKSNLIKKLNLNEKDEFITLEQLSKMNLKERMDYKNSQLELNSLNNIYESVEKFLTNKGINKDKTKQIVSEVVIEGVNETISNNILNSKELYTGLVLIRADRLDNLFNKLTEDIKLI